MNFKGRDFLTLLDYTDDEINYLIDLAMDFKKKKQNNIEHKYLSNKNVAIIFEKDSTRTRCSFEVAAYDLGMGLTYLGPTGSQMGKKETIADTARVLASMYDGIEYRGFGQNIVNDLAKYSKVPVWNGLTNEFHPTQILGDLLTIKEEFGHLKGLKVVFMGDGRNNVSNSLISSCAKMGMNYVTCSPKKLWPSEELIKKSKLIAKEYGGSVKVTDDIDEALKDADVIYTDVWLSMGEDVNAWKERIELLLPYQVNKESISKAKSNVIFMHCLPSFHNTDTIIGKEIYDKFGVKEMEVTDEVFESEHSRVFKEAENRMHSIKAIMYATLKDE